MLTKDVIERVVATFIQAFLVSLLSVETSVTLRRLRWLVLRLR